MITKKFIVVTLLSLLMPVLLSAKVFLVAVGISDYPGTEDDLRLPANDAQTITDLYKKSTVVTFCQLLNERATCANIETAMKKVYAQAKEDDIVVFYYSGHGYEGGFCAYDDFLDYSVIRKSMARTKCKNKMIFADACFSGKIRTGKRQAPNAGDHTRRANVMLFLSSRSNETSLERTDMTNGFFTTYLKKGLLGAADINKDNVVTAKELFKFVHSRVVQATKQKQHPVMWGNFANNMPVMIDK